MTAFLTSRLGVKEMVSGTRKMCRIRENNGFLDRLRKVWPKQARCLLICAEPEKHTMNNEMRRDFSEAFWSAGLLYSQLIVCDSRNEAHLPSFLSACDVLILSGGHTLTQNQFFKRLNLKQLISQFEGVLIGESGGSMNCAKVVYAQPE